MIRVKNDQRGWNDEMREIMLVALVHRADIHYRC